jgi:hypothetical protein
MNLPAIHAGFIGVPEDYLERSQLELDRAIAASRIVELRTRPEFREFKPDQLTLGAFRTLVDPDGNRYKVNRGECFHRGRLVEQLPSDLCAFLVHADLDPPVVVMLERVWSPGATA